MATVATILQTEIALARHRRGIAFTRQGAGTAIGQFGIGKCVEIDIFLRDAAIQLYHNAVTAFAPLAAIAIQQHQHDGTDSGNNQPIK